MDVLLLSYDLYLYIQLIQNNDGKSIQSPFIIIFVLDLLYIYISISSNDIINDFIKYLIGAELYFVVISFDIANDNFPICCPSGVSMDKYIPIE